MQRWSPHIIFRTWIRTLLSMLLCLSVHCVFFNHKIIRLNSLKFIRYKKTPSIFGSSPAREFIHVSVIIGCKRYRRLVLFSWTIAIFASSSHNNFSVAISNTSKRRKRVDSKDKEFLLFKIESIFLLSVCLNEIILLNFQSHRLRSKVFPLNSDKEPTQITIYCLQMSMYHTISRCVCCV